jgi:hypothetical protein
VDTLISDLTTGLPDYTIGHNDTGDDFIVGNDQWRGAVTARSMSDPHNVTMAWQYAPTGWILGFHISMRADNEAWALVSTFGGTLVRDPNDPNTTIVAQDGPFVREILQVGVKPPFLGQVRRLIHDRANWASPNYWDSPRAAISRDGRFVAWTSNNNGVSGVDRTDLFIAKIDPAPSSLVTLPTPSPTPSPNPSPSPTPVGTPQPATDTQPPVATITFPGPGAIVSGTITVTANASDNVGVDSAYLILDGVVSGADLTSPYSFNLDTTKLTDGSHVLYVRAWDAAGNAGDSAVVTFTVANAQPSPTPTPSPSPSATPTPTPTPSPTPTPLPSPTPSPCKKLPNGKCRKS